MRRDSAPSATTVAARLVEIRVVGRGPEDGRDRHADLALEAVRELERGDRLQPGVARPAEQSGLLPGRDDDAVAGRDPLEALGRGARSGRAPAAASPATRAPGNALRTASAWLRHSSAPRGRGRNQPGGAAPSSTARVSAPPPSDSVTTRGELTRAASGHLWYGSRFTMVPAR